MMRALVLAEFGRMEVRPLPQPKAGPGQVVVRTLATGICGSDLHGFTGHTGRRAPGQVMGHETVGRVHQLGPGVSGPPVGTLVTYNPVVAPQGAAPDDASAAPFVIGVRTDYVAAFAEQVVVPEGNLVPLPEATPVAEGTLVEPIAVAFHALRRSMLGGRPSRLLIIGGGPIGQSLVVAAQSLGVAHVLVSEPRADRRALLTALGATAVDPQSSPVDQVVLEKWEAPSDVTVDAVGTTASLTSALSATKEGGVVCLVGMGDPTLNLDAYAISTAQRAIIGSFAYTHDDFVTAAALVSRNDGRLAPLISEQVSLEQGPQAFRNLASGSPVPGKVVIRFEETRDAGGLD